jgi:hypothetical protein
VSHFSSNQLSHSHTLVKILAITEKRLYSFAMTTTYPPKTQEFLTNFSDQAVKMMMATKLMGSKISKGPVDTPAVLFYAVPGKENPLEEEVGVVEINPEDGQPGEHIFNWLINVYKDVSVAPIWGGIISDVVAHVGGLSEEETVRQMHEIKNRYPGKNLQEIYMENPLEDTLTEGLSTIIFDSYGNFATNFTAYKYSDSGTPVFDFEKSLFVGSMFDDDAESYSEQLITSQIQAFIIAVEITESTRVDVK